MSVSAARHSVELGDERESGLPPFVSRFLRSSDWVESRSALGVNVLVSRPRSNPKLLYATISVMKQSGSHVRVELRQPVENRKVLVISAGALRRYFYQLDSPTKAPTLYERLDASELATPGDLRMAWRIKRLDLNNRLSERIMAERAFNILAHPALRECYNLLCRDENAHPLFPYAGPGAILVEGNVSDDGTFFADRILMYKPELSTRQVSFLLRRCEFVLGRIACWDARRKLEVWLDDGLVPGLNWDPTWRHWKRRLRSRIQVDATFVRTAEYQTGKNHWVALPSRLQVAFPDEIADDIRQAQAIHALFGEHTNLIDRIRTEVWKQPIEHHQIQAWFDQFGASAHLKPQHVTWQPDYDAYYFDQLRVRAATWFLFRDEYLFIWATLLISEIPQAGHATYVFKKPWDVSAFMIDYAQADREDIRCNRNNAATRLGFVDRVVREKDKKRWLRDVLELAGECSEEMEVNQ